MGTAAAGQTARHREHGEGVSPGLWPPGHVSSAATSLVKLFPRATSEVAFLAGGSTKLLPPPPPAPLGAGGWMPAEVSLRSDISALRGQDKDPALITRIKSLLEEAFGQNL